MPNFVYCRQTDQAPSKQYQIKPGQMSPMSGMESHGMEQYIVNLSSSNGVEKFNKQERT